MVGILEVTKFSKRITGTKTIKSPCEEAWLVMVIDIFDNTFPVMRVEGDNEDTKKIAEEFAEKVEDLLCL